LTGRFHTYVTFTLTPDWGLQHTVVYRSSPSYLHAKFVQIGKKLFVDGQTYGHTGGRTLRPALLGRPELKRSALKRIQAQFDRLE